jgi:glycosyltransferase involved in cell wall biosynthesis
MMNNYLFFCVLFFGSFISAFATAHKILAASPVRQKPAILSEFLNSLKRLDQKNYTLDFYFIDDNDNPESHKALDDFAVEMGPKCKIIKPAAAPSTPYVCNDVTHFWNDQLVWKVAGYKDQMIQFARNNNYDYLFLIDSDIVLHPETISRLIADNKEIVSNIFWTIWTPGNPSLPQVWLTDFYTQFEMNPGENLTQEEALSRRDLFLAKLKKPGVYEVGGLGACTLISRAALKREISFKKIKNLTFWGEDRHFCVRAAALGIPLFVDTHYPAYHIYREENLAGVSDFIKSCDLMPKTGPRITLSMIMKNESGHFLRKMLEAAKEYITDAVIIDDASTDNSVEMAKEILEGIPFKIVQNRISKFSNEIVLRKQQWEETIKTNPEWIVLLDADQIFEDKFKDEVKKLVAEKDVDVYYFRLYDLWDESHYRDDQYWCAHNSYHPFLIRYKPGTKYLWRETAQHCGSAPYTAFCFPGKKSEMRLKHYGWSTKTARIEKYDRYMRLDPGAKFGWKGQYDSILEENPHLVSWQE